VKRGSSSPRYGAVVLFLFAEACCVFPGNRALAQTEPGSGLVVAIHTAAGETIPGAKVTLRAGKGEPYSSETDAAGIATFSGISPEKYRLSIIARGFDDLSTEVTVEAIPDNRIDAILSPPARGQHHRSGDD